ncbi:MAG: DeoR/GlpR transcriptional regulator [Firmicutes bacterium]|nr:DeoR/GlpR transcriptional regulator [Candidatus Colivicinus equi]
MYQEERQKKILDLLNENKKISVKELSKILDTSVVTIRSDVKKLQNNDLLVKTHGGVMVNSYKIDDVIPSNIKFQKHRSEKKKIANLTARFINDGDAIIIDSGSTTLELARKITQNELTVFTNDLQVALEISTKKNVKLIVTGGSLIPGVYTMTSPESVETYKQIHVQKLFISCDALDLEFGISNRDKREVDIKRAMLKSADEKYLLVDSSKLNQKVLVKIAELKEFDYLITDKIPTELKNQIEMLGVKVITE